MAYQIQSEQFSGPLDLLLQLIEKEELNIASVQLAKVTEAYLAHLQTVQEKRPNEMADFLVIATKLLYLKSSLLLPEPELELETGFDLETQLKIYRDFMVTAKKVDGLWKSGTQLFHREKPTLSEADVRFLPPPELTVAILHDAFRTLLVKLQPLLKLPETEMRRVVTLAEKMHQLERAIHEKSEIMFQDYLRGAESKGEAIVSFLAMLELVKQRVIHVEQEQAFCDILLRRVVE